MGVSSRGTAFCTIRNRQTGLIKTLHTCRRTLSIKSKCIVHARRQSAACVAQVLKGLPQADKLHDDELSRRDLELDQMGYFIILLDRENSVIVVDHYNNTINEQGLACDETTGEVISCSGSVRKPNKSFRGRTAKQLSVAILEENSGFCSRLEHANYLGRELQKAEFALTNSLEYIQD